MKIAKFFAASLKAYRWHACITQQELADATELKKSYISSLEMGERPAPFEVVVLLATALGIDPCELIADVIKRISNCPAEAELDPLIRQIGNQYKYH